MFATATDGRGVDIVVDNVGTVTFERSLRSLARGGRLVINGSTTGREAGLHLPTLFWRQLEVIGATMNDHREFADAMQLVGSGTVEIPIDATFGFEELPGGDRAARGRATARQDRDLPLTRNPRGSARRRTPVTRRNPRGMTRTYS